MGYAEKWRKTPMQIDLSQPILDLEDQPIKMGRPTKEDPAKQVDLTLGIAAFECLLKYQSQGPVDAEDNFKRYECAKKVAPSKASADLTPEDMTLIKKCAGGFFTPIVYGRIREKLS